MLWREKQNVRFVGWLATQIPDPLSRLRFLRRFAPRPSFRARAARSRQVLLQIAPAMVAVVAVSLLLTRPSGTLASPSPSARVVGGRPGRAPKAVQAVWQVERQSGFEAWSNGLRIDNRFRARGRPRSYTAFEIGDPPDDRGVRRTDPAGIVFHTTESEQVPFQANQTEHLRRIGESLLEYVQRRAAYNFLIDRFGRVYRIVPEAEVANHAGWSVWADDRWLYVNLNNSFLGVSFEARTEPGQTDSAITPAQVRAAAMLIEMLRSRYGIPAANCVTHGQVSVNPDNMRVGYHTDWASSFPFETVGLPDNYSRPPPALWALGFEYDSVFLKAAGSRLSASVEAADCIFAARAARASVTSFEYRRLLQKSYRAKLAIMRQSGPESE